MLLYYGFPAPETLAWIQLLRAVVAGVGAFLFFRHALGVGFWPAAIGGWCYPVTAYFILWQGYYATWTLPWLPWLLLAVDQVIRRPLGWAGPALALVTALTLVSGAFDIAGQVMLTSGLYALWRLIGQHGKAVAPLCGSAAVVLLAWAAGFAIAAPYWLPVLEYTRTGARVVRRQSGIEERPPIGLEALPQIVMPGIYGSTRSDSLWIGTAGNFLESSAATYTGLLATLFLAPLAWCSPRHRSVNWFWAALAVFANWAGS